MVVGESRFGAAIVVPIQRSLLLSQD